jgi:hypothetical protein
VLLKVNSTLYRIVITGKSCKESTLPLLVLLVLADDVHHALAADDLAIPANLFN